MCLVGLNGPGTPSRTRGEFDGASIRIRVVFGVVWLFEWSPVVGMNMVWRRGALVTTVLRGGEGRWRWHMQCRRNGVGAGGASGGICGANEPPHHHPPAPSHTLALRQSPLLFRFHVLVGFAYPHRRTQLTGVLSAVCQIYVSMRVGSFLHKYMSCAAVLATTIAHHL